MKYCTKCGTQLLDEAVICTKCGCMVAGVPVTKPKAPRVPASKQAKAPDPNLLSKVLDVFNFGFELVAIIALFFIILGIGYEDDLRVVATIFTVFTFGFSVPAFVGTLTEKLKGERFFAGITKLFISFALLIASIVLLAN